MVGDAEELPFDDDQFDIYTVAFGIRNVTHIEQVSDSTTTELDGNTDVPITTTFVTQPPHKAADQILFNEMWIFYNLTILVAKPNSETADCVTENIS